MEMYSREEIADQKELRKRAKLAAVIVSVLAAVVCVFLLIFVKPLNETLFRVIATVCAALAGCFDIYIASFIMPYMRPKPKQRSAGGKVLHVLGNILRQMHMYIIWILLSGIIVSFLFNLATDTTAAKKVTIYVDVESVMEKELETALNEDLPEGIKMVKVHTFSYHTFGMSNVGADDIYIVRAGDVVQYRDGFAPMEEFLGSSEAVERLRQALGGGNSAGSPGGADGNSPGDLYIDGKLCGLLIYYWPLTDSGASSGHIDYSMPGGGDMAYYLFFGKDCKHP